MNLLQKKASKLDNDDFLSQYRDEFYYPASSPIYLDGNSLGLMSKRAESSLIKSMNDWKTFAIDGWTEGTDPWLYYSETLSKLTAPLIGARESEVTVTGSITTNLHQLVASLYQPKGKRKKILTDELAFPTDVYVLESQLILHGEDPMESLIKVKSTDGHTLNEEDIIDQMNDDVCLILLPTVFYRSGQLLNINKLTKAAHDRGIIIGFDLAHSIGVVPHDLNHSECDFAVWCTYKYLNSGPGGVAGLFIHERHHGRVPGLTGWFGSDKTKQFDMAHTFTPANNASAYQLGTPHIFSMAPLLGSLEMFEEIGMKCVREKSLTLTSYLREAFEDLNKLDNKFIVITPYEDVRRGGHIAVTHPDAARICKDLKTKGVIPDYRAPNVIRFAPSPLYSSYDDLWQTYMILKNILENKTFERFSNERNIIA
ncbi:kynureninase [Salipaludibacillus daqingensis]|uniref:kynureninase n=1 Tax=Salipaludibacillus daqingensis TaxID=3041001 RepID=UPI002476A6DB|nr:kynureninase [Salipaludibacillus daqingensis]